MSVVNTLGVKVLKLVIAPITESFDCNKCYHAKNSLSNAVCLQAGQVNDNCVSVIKLNPLKSVFWVEV